MESFRLLIRPSPIEIFGPKYLRFYIITRVLVVEMHRPLKIPLSKRSNFTTHQGCVVIKTAIIGYVTIVLENDG